MDPTILAAAAGIAGGVIGAIIGGVFALKATKRQVEVMLLQSRGDVNERLYSQSLMIIKFFAENPELRPYFYDNKDLSRAEKRPAKTESTECGGDGGRLHGVGGAPNRGATCGNSASVEELSRRLVQLQCRGT